MLSRVFELEEAKAHGLRVHVYTRSDGHQHARDNPRSADQPDGVLSTAGIAASRGRGPLPALAVFRRQPISPVQFVNARDPLLRQRAGLA
jgi:hypothetical protein